MNDGSIVLEGVSFAYPDGHAALFDVDLRIASGERVALLGPNGAGKTTLVLHLNGIFSPAAGTVSIGGSLVEAASLKEVRRRVGIVFQDPDDQLFMPTVRDDVAFGPVNLGMSGTELDRAVDGALQAVGMQGFAARPPHHLSFGQRKRVALATVLSMSPDVLVLDEPTSNLDPAGRRELSDVLRALRMTTLIVTHDLPYALELCPRSIIMNGGVIVADGPTDEILRDEDLLRRNRLELSFGFDPRTVSS